MNTLTQKNGKNSRSFSVDENGVIAHSKLEGNESSVTLLFNETGPLREGDFEYHQIRELRMPSGTRRLLIASGFSGWLIFTIAGDTINKEHPSSLLGTGLVIVGMSCFFATILYLFLTINKVRCKRLFFASGASINPYCRNEKEEDQVNDFVQQVNASFWQLSKKHFLAALEAKEANLQIWLKNLNEKGVFSDDEYRTLSEKVAKLSKKKA